VNSQPEKPIDAEFVEDGERTARPTQPDPKQKQSGPAGFGTRVVAEERPRAAEVIGDIIDVSASAARAVSSTARFLGKEEVAGKVEKAAEVAGQAADVVQKIPAAIEGFKREAAPVKAAFEKLAASVKKSGLYARREPKTVHHAPKRRHGKPMDDPPTEAAANEEKDKG